VIVVSDSREIISDSVSDIMQSVTVDIISDSIHRHSVTVTVETSSVMTVDIIGDSITVTASQ